MMLTLQDMAKTMVKISRPLTNLLLKTSLAKANLTACCSRSRLKSRKIESDFSNSFKIMIFWEKEFFPSKSLEESCTHRKSNWLIVSMSYLKSNLKSLMIPLKSIMWHSMRKLIRFSLRRAWKRIQPKRLKSSKHPPY